MYTSLMNAYSKDKKMQNGYERLSKNAQEGCQSDSYACNTLILGLSRWVCLMTVGSCTIR
ncbi:hypothetical protein SLEP1_g28081 [Rubroshorea leprosula]|uniref:Uncharacterized protein n=1 Tax=Rubroshorea leprosula TaxID=152421 RepID=A0AAV5JY33_9ROSI|nr:hypothetical protein SLEP1_g28081 [Rubroshorea leprosula]